MPTTGAMSNYLETAILNAVLRGIPYSTPPTVYVALYTTDPTDEDIGVEVSGEGYVRQPVTFGEPSDGVVSNTEDILFPVASANWGTITHVGIRDAETGGNLLFHSALEMPKTIEIGDQLKIPAGQLVISLD